MARILSFLIRYFSNYYTLHRSDLAARAAPLDPRLYTTHVFFFFKQKTAYEIGVRLVGSEMCIRDRDIKSSLFSLLYKRGSRGAARAAKSL